MRDVTNRLLWPFAGLRALDSRSVEHVPLGPLQVSRVGLGCNNFGGRLDRAGSRAVVDAAIAAGITFFDTADIYGGRGGSEQVLGEVLQGRRDQVVLATKFGGEMGDEGPARGAPAYVRQALERSLARLRTDHVDLLYYHWPDEITPIGETVAAMAGLVAEGKVRALGVSNLTAEQLDEAAAAGPIAALQNEYSLLDRSPERDILPRCRELGIGFVPYYPLAAGLLTGKYRHGQPPAAGHAPGARGVAGRRHVGNPRRRGLGGGVPARRPPDRVRGGAPPQPARARHRRARLAARRGVGDRRRDDARTGAGQRAAPATGGSTAADLAALPAR